MCGCRCHGCCNNFHFFMPPTTSNTTIINSVAMVPDYNNSSIISEATGMIYPQFYPTHQIANVTTYGSEWVAPTNGYAYISAGVDSLESSSGQTASFLKFSIDINGKTYQSDQIIRVGTASTFLVPVAAGDVVKIGALTDVDGTLTYSKDSSTIFVPIKTIKV